MVGADGFGNFFVVPSRGALDATSLNARGGVTIDPRGQNPDFNPEVIKVLTSSSPDDIAQAEIGDFAGDITGVMDINFDFWTVRDLTRRFRTARSTSLVYLEIGQGMYLEIGQGCLRSTVVSACPGGAALRGRVARVVSAARAHAVCCACSSS